jgi:hypothetical protein
MRRKVEMALPRFFSATMKANWPGTGEPWGSMRLGDYVPAYRKRRIEADKKRRAIVIQEQLQAERQRDKVNKHANSQEIITALQRINADQQAYGKQQQAEDNRRDARERRRFWLDVAALVIAGIAAFFLFRQQNVMQGTLDEMREEGRPWVQGTVDFVGPLIFDKDGARAPIKLLLRNSGKSPAKNVWRGVRMYAGGGPDTLIMGWENALCQHITRDARKGITIFPNETPGSQLPVGIDATEVQKNIDTDGGIIVRIIMCIDYAFPFSPDRHQTSYIWEVDKKDPIAGFAHIKPSDGAIQPNELLQLTDPSLPGRAN